MLSDEQVRELLLSRGIDLVGSLSRDSDDNSKIYAFIRVKREADNKRIPSNFELSKISSSLAEKGVHLSFVITNSGESDIEGTVKSLLFRSFPELVRNVFASFSDKKVSIWIDPKRVLSHDDEEKIGEKCTTLLRVLDEPLEAVRFTSSENVPTRTACLKVIRLRAPISRDDLSQALVRNGFHIPNGEWMSRMLDSLRKAGLVVRRKDGGYILTYIALKNLGSAKNSKSPDISRALDLSRRG